MLLFSELPKELSHKTHPIISNVVKGPVKWPKAWRNIGVERRPMLHKHWTNISCCMLSLNDQLPSSIPWLSFQILRRYKYLFEKMSLIEIYINLNSPIKRASRASALRFDGPPYSGPLPVTPWTSPTAWTRPQRPPILRLIYPVEVCWYFEPLQRNLSLEIGPILSARKLR